ncbi:MAG TPA: amidase [Solirubrobacteraceae bacterium]|nr:amidase [Solirubrobacteraceae bacterium]
MPVQPPTEQTLARLAARHGLDLSGDDLAAYGRVIAKALPSFARLDELAEPKLPVRYARTPGHRPAPEENPLNGWYWRCSIEGAPGGPLSGKTVALKDSICVAGVPMMNGCALLEGFVPDVDATIVTRILDAGGTIAGKATCEHLGVSDGSHTSDNGPVPNPHDPSRTAGGSSSGCAVLVATGAVDMAIGGDQAGSIRMPASFSGTYGLKPTYGLVPYSGVFEGEYTLDHVGPMAATVRDTALLLAAIAGPDGIDPRQVDVEVGDYAGALEQGVEGLRVGILAEGFDWPGAEPEVARAVRSAAEGLRELGAVVEDVSIPLHRDSPHIWRAIAAEGALVRVIRGNGQGVGTKGYYNTPLIDAFGRARARNANDFSVTVKYVVLLGEYLHERYGSHYYAKARNLSRRLAAAYDDALSRHDVLVMPTTVMRATPLPGPDASLEERVQRAFEVNDSTCGFDVTGHPAMSIPCARVGGLPVGLMAVGAPFAEATVLRVARACEVTCSA